MQNIISGDSLKFHLSHPTQNAWDRPVHNLIVNEPLKKGLVEISKKWGKTPKIFSKGEEIFWIRRLKHGGRRDIFILREIPKGFGQPGKMSVTLVRVCKSWFFPHILLACKLLLTIFISTVADHFQLIRKFACLVLSSSPEEDRLENAFNWFSPVRGSQGLKSRQNSQAL